MIFKTNLSLKLVIFANWFFFSKIFSLNMLQDLSDLHYLSDSIFIEYKNTFSDLYSQESEYLINNQTFDYKNWDRSQITNAKHKLLQHRQAQARHRIDNRICYSEFIDIQIREPESQFTGVGNTPFGSSIRSNPIPDYSGQNKHTPTDLAWPKQNCFPENKYYSNFGGFFGRLLQQGTSSPAGQDDHSKSLPCLIRQPI